MPPQKPKYSDANKKNAIKDPNNPRNMTSFNEVADEISMSWNNPPIQYGNGA